MSVKKLAFGALLLAAIVSVARPAAQAPPVLVTLWFDTEDYILPQDDEATKRLAEMLTRLGVRATFKIVGEKARVLEQRGRKDVIQALRGHEIGYHSNTHSQPPTIAVYLQHAGWDDGIAEFLRREAAGARDVERILGRRPVAYGQPGSAWAPQAYPALRSMGIRLYLDEADHVGLDDQPFYYGGMLNVFRMRSTLARMELKGGTSLADGKTRFSEAADRVRAKGGGTVSVYYHPCEWVQTAFWDAVNFSGGANPPRSAWKQPGVRPRDETERAFADFAQFISFIKAQPGVRFVTASDLLEAYADRALTRGFTRNEMLAIARAVQQPQNFLVRGDYALSVADMFSILTEAVAGFEAQGSLPASVTMRNLDGPADVFAPSAAVAQSPSFAWDAFARATNDVVSYTASAGRVPAEVWVGSEALSPSDYLATLGASVETIVNTGRAPETVVRRAGSFAADRYVAPDSPDLWRWPIFPKGFHAPRIMELARLQAWTLKPAIMRRAP